MEFKKAAAFVSSQSERVLSAASTQQRLRLYGLYKQALQGDCTSSRPAFYLGSAVHRWDAWSQYKGMGTVEAQEQYVHLVTLLCPTWLHLQQQQQQEKEKEKEEGESTETFETEDDLFLSDSETPRRRSSGGAMGTVVSREKREDKDVEERMEPIEVAFEACRQGDLLQLQQTLNRVKGTAVHQTDSEGRTLLHWAVDGGHTGLVSWLIQAGADVQARDVDGQTPLHYAVVCERADMYRLLIKHGADPLAKDSEGQTAEAPLDLT